MTRTQEILAAIADGLAGSRRDVVLVIAMILGAALVFGLAAIVVSRVQRRQRDRAFRDRYEREIRRLDLTIRQLDVIDQLAEHLSDPGKKYLLLTNANTFRSCQTAAGKLAPPLDVSIRTLEQRLGFDGPARVSLELERFLPASGTSVKLEVPGAQERTLARVVDRSKRRLEVKTESDLKVLRDTEVLIYAPHPSGIVMARGTVLSVNGSDMSIGVSRPFALPDARQYLDRALRVFVRAEGRQNDPVSAELRQLSPSGALLENPGRRFRKGDDVQIVLRRNHARWVVMNAEVVGRKKRGGLIRVRFSHLSRAAREEILGKSGSE